MRETRGYKDEPYHAIAHVGRYRETMVDRLQIRRTGSHGYIKGIPRCRSRRYHGALKQETESSAQLEGKKKQHLNMGGSQT